MARGCPRDGKTALGLGSGIAHDVALAKLGVRRSCPNSWMHMIIPNERKMPRDLAGRC